jgi:ribosomal 50S subunit-recycling heat shock protein
MSATYPHQAHHHQDDACRLDVWLWRARFFKTRGLAAQFLDEGRVRLIRPGSEAVRVDKPSRAIRPGDGLVFAIGGRLVAIRIEALGERRGPPGEARGLYSEAPH